MAESLTIPAPAQLSDKEKIYFWYNSRTQHIMQGAGPRWDMFLIPGYERITCNHAHEAEMWSKRLSEQDQRVAEMEDYDRELFEAPIRQDLRRELKEKLRKAPNSPSAMLLQMALRDLDDKDRNGKTIRESHLHVEAFEHGK